jgi:hypothetical protein
MLLDRSNLPYNIIYPLGYVSLMNENVRANKEHGNKRDATYRPCRLIDTYQKPNDKRKRIVVVVVVVFLNNVVVVR